jgi:hypothetical protein
MKQNGYRSRINRMDLWKMAKKCIKHLVIGAKEEKEKKKRRNNHRSWRGEAHLHHHTLSPPTYLRLFSSIHKSHTSHTSFLIRAKGEVA